MNLGRVEFAEALFPLPMNPPLHPSQEGNLQPAPQTKLPSWEGLGVGSWAQGTIKVRGGLTLSLSPGERAGVKGKGVSDGLDSFS